MQHPTDAQMQELHARLPVPPDEPAWCFVEHGVVSALEHDIETRFVIGNGFLGVRGSLEEGYPRSRPRTFVAGLFDRSTGEPPIPALVPAPDWLCLQLYVNGQPLALDAGKLQSHVRTLDVRYGTVWRDWRHSTAAGDTVHLRTVRWATLHDRHSAVQLA